MDLGKRTSWLFYHRLQISKDFMEFSDSNDTSKIVDTQLSIQVRLKLGEGRGSRHVLF